MQIKYRFGHTKAGYWQKVYYIFAGSPASCLQKFICNGGFLRNIGINIGVLGAFVPNKIGNALRFPYLAVFI